MAKIGQGLLAALGAWAAVVVLGYGPSVTDAMMLASVAVSSPVIGATQVALEAGERVRVLSGGGVSRVTR